MRTCREAAAEIMGLDEIVFFARVCLFLSVFVRFCSFLFAFVRFCLLLFAFVRFCLLLFAFVRFCLLLFACLRLLHLLRLFAFVCCCSLLFSFVRQRRYVFCMLDEINAEFKQVLTADKIRTLVDLIPAEWLEREDIDETAEQARKIYYQFLITRINNSEIFTNEAQNARKILI